MNHKLVLLGDMGVGKSCISIRLVIQFYLISRFVYGKFAATHEATIGACFLTKNVELEEHSVKYEIWDTAGQERYHSLAAMYYK